MLAFANGDELTLTCDGAGILLVRDEASRYWTVATGVPFGTLVLESRRGGEVVARDVLRPAGEAVRLDTALWQAPDGSPIARTRASSARGVPDRMRAA